MSTPYIASMHREKMERQFEPNVPELTTHQITEAKSRLEALHRKFDDLKLDPEGNLFKHFRQTLDQLETDVEVDEFFDILFNRAVDPFHNFTFLHHLKDPALVAHFVKRGAVVEVRDNDGYTPFLWHVVEERWSMCQALLEAGANANATDHTGCNAYHLAVNQENPAMIVHLAKWGRTDINARNAHNDTPASLAKKMYADSCLVELIRAGATPPNDSDDDESEPEMINMCDYGATKPEWNWIEQMPAGENVAKYADKDGRTILFQGLSYEEARCWLDKGADLEATDNLGDTPLRHFVRIGIFSHAATLVRCGASLGTPQQKKEFAVRLLQALPDQHNEALEVVKILEGRKVQQQQSQ